jgi:hypothetical protein
MQRLWSATACRRFPIRPDEQDGDAEPTDATAESCRASAWHDPEHMPGNMQGNMLPQVDFPMRTTGSLTRPLAVTEALVNGAILPALGVWSPLGGKEVGEGVRS